MNYNYVSKNQDYFQRLTQCQNIQKYKITPIWLHQLRQYFIIIENILSISDIKIVDALTYFFRQAQVIVDVLPNINFRTAYYHWKAMKYMELSQLSGPLDGSYVRGSERPICRKGHF